MSIKKSLYILLFLACGQISVSFYRDTTMMNDLYDYNQKRKSIDYIVYKMKSFANADSEWINSLSKHNGEMTPLYRAVSIGDIEPIKALLSLGADPFKISRISKESKRLDCFHALEDLSKKGKHSAEHINLIEDILRNPDKHNIPNIPSRRPGAVKLPGTSIIEENRKIDAMKRDIASRRQRDMVKKVAVATVLTSFSALAALKYKYGSLKKAYASASSYFNKARNIVTSTFSKIFTSST